MFGRRPAKIQLMYLGRLEYELLMAYAEDDELGPGHQGDRQPEALLHALGEAAHPVAGPVGEADEAQALALLAVGHRGPRQPHVQGQHLGGGEPGLVAEQLREVPDAGPGAGVAGGTSVAGGSAGQREAGPPCRHASTPSVPKAPTAGGCAPAVDCARSSGGCRS